MNKPLTKTQLKVLRSLDATQYKFAPKATCEALKQRGLVESDLRIQSHDYRTGMVRFSLAYRLTQDGLKHVTDEVPA